MQNELGRELWHEAMAVTILATHLRVCTGAWFTICPLNMQAKTAHIIHIHPYDPYGIDEASRSTSVATGSVTCFLLVVPMRRPSTTAIPNGTPSCLAYKQEIGYAQMIMACKAATMSSRKRSSRSGCSFRLKQCLRGCGRSSSSPKGAGRFCGFKAAMVADPEHGRF